MDHRLQFSNPKKLLFGGNVCIDAIYRYIRVRLHSVKINCGGARAHQLTGCGGGRISTYDAAFCGIIVNVFSARSLIHHRQWYGTNREKLSVRASDRRNETWPGRTTNDYNVS